MRWSFYDGAHFKGGAALWVDLAKGTGKKVGDRGARWRALIEQVLGTYGFEELDFWFE